MDFIVHPVNPSLLAVSSSETHDPKPNSTDEITPVVALVMVLFTL